MIEEINLDSWESFEKEITNVPIPGTQLGQSPSLFRGQSNSKWFLHTTL
jgi:hypothetical protein